jgi:hypothetical protein
MSVERAEKGARGWRRLAAEVAILTAMGAFLGAIGAIGSYDFPIGLKYGYWLVNLVGGGLIGIVIDHVLGRWPLPPWRRVLMVSVLMTPFVTLIVLAASYVFFGQGPHLDDYVRLLWQVFVVSLPVMTARELVWRKPEPRVETRTIVVPPLPEAEAVFRRRLSAKRRTARLIAVEAYDHYLRVHTDQGEELITLRFADALSELALAHGYRVHRSWWIAAEAIEAVSWRRGVGEARLADGLVAPVSRGQAQILKEAGWT